MLATVLYHKWYPLKDTNIKQVCFGLASMVGVRWREMANLLKTRRHASSGKLWKSVSAPSNSGPDVDSEYDYQQNRDVHAPAVKVSRNEISGAQD
jgi:hypothetical protein